MSFWLQLGSGKGDKVVELVDRDALDGLILSPAHESKASLVEIVRDMTRRGIAVMLDPQTYVYSIAGASAQRHPDHGLEFDEVHWSIDPAVVDHHVRAVIAANDALGIAGPIIAPSVLQRGFREVWAVAALQYARAAARLAPGRDVLASLVIEDGALGDWEPIQEWLDVATTLPLRGFYVVVARESRAYPVAWDAQRVANLMRITFRLSELNGYQLLLGYADFDALGVTAAGAAGMASGWHYSLRTFRSDRWIRGGFGRTATPRVTSGPLLTPISARGEAELVARTRLGLKVLPNPDVRRAMASHPERWSNAAAQVQHLMELSEATRRLESLSLRRRLEAVRDQVQQAIELLDGIEAEGIQMQPAYRPRLVAMATAVRLFRDAEAI